MSAPRVSFPAPAQLTVEEAERHDAELLCRAQEPVAGFLACGVVLEATARAASAFRTMHGVVDRQAAGAL